MRKVDSTVLLSALALASLVACSRDRANKTPMAAAAPMAAPLAQPATPPTTASATGTVVETMDAASYTYVRVKTNSNEIWAATGQFKVAVGDKVSVPLEMPMENFRSNTLKRTFPTIYFATRIEKQGGSITK